MSMCIKRLCIKPLFSCLWQQLHYSNTNRSKSPWIFWSSSSSSDLDFWAFRMCPLSSIVTYHLTVLIETFYVETFKNSDNIYTKYMLMKLNFNMHVITNKIVLAFFFSKIICPSSSLNPPPTRVFLTENKKDRLGKKTSPTSKIKWSSHSRGMLTLCCHGQDDSVL